MSFLPPPLRQSSILMEEGTLSRGAAQLRAAQHMSTPLLLQPAGGMLALCRPLAAHGADTLF